jgi:uncharacterized membrane protein SpoIIM required for sporulation
VISTRWLQQRQTYWTRLEALIERSSSRGVTSLNREELRELGLLYRQIAADLAAVREHPGSTHFADYLNRLLARAHHTIYSTERTRPVGGLLSFLRDYPSIFRRNLTPALIALGLFAAGILAGAVVTYRNPDFTTQILGPEMVDTIERREMWTHSIVAIKPVASTQIMTNNMSVSLTAFALGITAGLGTAYVLFFNGLMLGVIGMACAAAGMSIPLWSFVAPHGALELPAIVVAGGAGLRLAQGILFPGLLPRKHAVVVAGREALQLVLGCLPILVLAGIIEAFVSPTDLAVWLKFATGASLFVLLVAYLSSHTEGPAKAGLHVQ